MLEIRFTSLPSCKKAFGKTFVLCDKVQQNITRTELSSGSKRLTLGNEGREGGRGGGDVDCKNTFKIAFTCHLLFHYYDAADALLLFGLCVP